MGALTKALDRGRGIVKGAFEGSLRLKADGNLVGQLSSNMEAAFGHFQDRARYQQRYSLYRGWIYAVIEAIGREAAGQPVFVGRLAGRQEPEKERGRPYLTKDLRTKMAHSVRTKAIQQDVELLSEHPLNKVLEHPNSFQNRWQFVFTFIANLSLTGWAFIVRDKNKDGTPEFYCLPTTWIEPLHKDGPFSGFRLRNPNKPGTQGVELKRKNVAFAHLPNPADPLSASAPAGSQILSIRIDDHIQASQERFFENGIFPSVIITMGQKPYMDTKSRPVLTGAQRRQIESVVRKKWGGVANYGNPAIIDGLIEKIERLSFSQQEMGWEKSEQTVKTRILSAYGVHPFILGENVSVGGYAQVHQIERRFCKRVNTYLDLLSNCMTNFIGQSEGDPELLIWWEECEAHNPQLHWQNLNAARNRGDIDEEEIRAALGYPPKEGEEEEIHSIADAQLTPITQLLAQGGAGAIQPEQITAVLEGVGIPTELAIRIAGKPSEEEVVQQATEGLEEAIAALRMPTAKLVDRIVRATKHLPGQHDQSSHARGGGGGGFTGKPANPRGRDTEEQYRTGPHSWTPEREALHDEIVAHFLKGKTPVDEPVSYMMGGGTAAGKSTMLKAGVATIPENTVKVDSDEIKGMLPEYQSMIKAGNPKAAIFSHEESSYLAKRIVKEASEQSYNVMLDGTGDSSVESVQKKVKLLKQRGQKVVAYYASVSTAEAITRSRARAEKTGRYVPEAFIHEVHRSVSRTLPKAMKQGIFDEVVLFDTTTREPVKIASGKGKSMKIHDQERWDAFVAKGEF